MFLLHFLNQTGLRQNFFKTGQLSSFSITFKTYFEKDTFLCTLMSISYSKTDTYITFKCTITYRNHIWLTLKLFTRYNITIANGKPVDATQELIAIGIANIANSFCLGYSGNGALSRGAVNNSSGVKTPFGSLYTGVLVILALLFFTPYFTYIPKAALGAVIIAAVRIIQKYYTFTWLTLLKFFY